MAPRQTATAERPATTQQRPPVQQQPAVQPGTALTAADAKAPHPIVAFKSYMDERMGEVALALPPHMTAERFGRVVLTALQRTPTLLKCTRQSLFNACMLAAQDGLLPDGREGAIVPYTDGKADQAQWMPMIEGLRKKARNSGDISNWEVHLVRQRDQFEVVLGDSPRIDHKPYFGADEPGDIIGAYSIAWLKDGTISRDVMTIRDIQKIKNISKAKNGPWGNPTFFGEMCKKTVARRHYKQLPHAAELDEFIKRLDEREGLADTEAGAEARQHQRIGSTAAAFDAFAGAGGAPASDVIDHETTQTYSDPPADELGGEFDGDAAGGGETLQQQPDKPAQAEKTEPKKNDAKAQPQQDAPAISQGDDNHRGDGGDDLNEGQPGGEAEPWPEGQEPQTEAEYERYADAVTAKMTDSAAIAGWFKGEEQRKLRNKAGVQKEGFDRVRDKLAGRIAQINKKKAG